MRRRDRALRIAGPVMGLAVVAGLVVGASWYAGMRGLSEAETSWCSSHPSAIADSAVRLQLLAPSLGTTWAGWADRAEADGVIGMFLSESITPPDRRADVARACRTAFESR